MNEFSLILTVTTIHIVALISPGPDFFMALKNSISYSRKIGIYTAIGFGIGISIHILYSVTGLAFIISKSELLFSIIKYLGAGYLFYIGLRSIISSPSSIDIFSRSKSTDISPLRAIKIGFTTNILNPKATLFFLSLFTLVIGPDVSNTGMIIISLILITTTIIWFSLVALFFTQKKIQRIFNQYQKTINIILGILLIGIALKIVFF